jgi:putative ABC transport system permease protein
MSPLTLPVHDIFHDVRHALRAMRARPGFTAVVVFTLAIGIGATTAIFSVVNGVLLHPLGFPNEGRLFTLCERYPGAPSDWCSISPPTVSDIAERSKSIAALGLGRSWESHMTTPDGQVAVASGIATPALFRALGVHVIRGRMIDSTDLLGRQSDVALLTYEMWRERFHSDPAVVGSLITLNTHPVRIVGVLQPGFHLPLFETIELWRPIHVLPRDEQYRDWRGFVAYGLLKPGYSIAQLRAELPVITGPIRREHFATTPGWGVTTMPLADLVVRDVRPSLLLFLGAVSLVLLIACANVSNLLLARSTEQVREVATRAALGAARGRIVRGLLAESLVLAVGGALVGGAIAVGGVAAFRALAPSEIPRVAEVAIDGHVLVFATLLAVVAAVLTGFVPALRAGRLDLAQVLREGGRSGAAARSRLGTLLVVAEIAMALVLVACAGTLTRSFMRFAAWAPGFEQQHVALFSLSPSSATYDTKEKLGLLWDRTEAALRAVPGVQAVGTASAGPLFGARETWEMEIEGRAPDQRESVRWYDVSPGFFAAVGVPLLGGRQLDEHDTPSSPSVALVNQTLARRFWPGATPLGKHIVFPLGQEREAFTIVGVVADVPGVEPGKPPEPEMYWSNRQQPRPYTWVWVRTTVPPERLAGAITSAVKAVDRDLVPSPIRTLPERLHRELAAPRFASLLFASLSVVALLLSAVGTYGLLAYLVTRRRREFGIRLAIGAQRSDVMRDVLWQGLAMVSAGLAVGLLGFLALASTLAAFAPGVPPRDPLVLGLASLVLIGIALLASIVPAWRAGRVDPAVTLVAE